MSPALSGILLAAVRLLPVALVSPFLGGPLVPAPVRMGLALTLGWAGHRLAGEPPGPSGLQAIALGAGGELLLGVALAFTATLPVEAARTGGRLADVLRGATLTELHVAPIRQRESALGDLLAQWCVVLGAWSGADQLLARGLLGTFARLPPGGALPAPLLGDHAVRVASEILSAGVALAAPAVAAVVAADLALAAAERLAPGLSVACALQPARAAAGLAAVSFGAAAASSQLTGLVARMGRIPLLDVGAPP